MPTAPMSMSVQPAGKPPPAALTVRLIAVVFVRLPLMPVTVTVAFPVVALVAADNVRVLVDVVLVGLKTAVTPEGNPEADRLTLPLKPLSGLTVIVLVPLVPWTIVKLLGEAESEKFGGGVTINVTFVLCTRLPLVPVTLTVLVLAGVLVVVVTVNVEEPTPLTEFGTKLAVAPVGKPPALKVTVLLKPLTLPTFTV